MKDPRYTDTVISTPVSSYIPYANLIVSSFYNFIDNYSNLTVCYMLKNIQLVII